MHLLSEVSAEPPTVYRIVSPAPMGQDHCSAESRICQSNALDKSGSWSIIITERFYRQAADLSYWLTYLEKQIAVTLAGAAILLLWCICRAKPRYISESKRCEAPDSATSASPPVLGSAKPPTVYRRTSPALYGQIHCNANRKICQTPPLFGRWGCFLRKNVIRCTWCYR